MKYFLLVLGSVLSTAAGAALPSPPSTLTTPTLTHAIKVRDSPVTYQSSKTPAPIVERGLSGDVTWIIQNQLPSTPVLSILGFSEIENKGTPVGTGFTGTFTSQTSIVVPTGWIGEFKLNKVGPRIISPYSSGIQGIWGGTNNVSLSVNYRQGYSVPITCACDAPGKEPAIVGCNKDLFSLNNKCPKLLDGSTQAPTCVNEIAPHLHPDPTAFFAPCKGVARTVPQEDSPEQYCANNQITCCVGTSCSAPAGQPKWSPRFSSSIMSIIT